jgi:hypothetical protein
VRKKQKRRTPNRLDHVDPLGITAVMTGFLVADHWRFASPSISTKAADCAGVGEFGSLAQSSILEVIRRRALDAALLAFVIGTSSDACGGIIEDSYCVCSDRQGGSQAQCSSGQPVQKQLWHNRRRARSFAYFQSASV